ncbi:MAG: glucose PTS transporter subunit IIA, partial [Steroidobacteraceae bacterium]
MSSLEILAPFDGWCSALDQVPDPVFAERMVGDGLAIDPISGVLLAPCAGEIMTLPASAHAVSIRAAPGIDVLIHVGIDTVALHGRGFEARVGPGALVRAGDELIRFDLETVARAAKSLMTPVVITPMDGLRLARRRPMGPVSAGELLFEVTRMTAPLVAAAGTAPPIGAADAAAVVAQTLVVTLRQGLHARPAALLAQRAKSFGAQISLGAHGRNANARSVVAIMALGVRRGDELSIEARGAGAEQAVASLVAALEEALRTEAAAHRDAAQDGAAADGAARLSGAAAAPHPGTFAAVAAVGGLAVGRATRIERREIDVAETGAGAAPERARLGVARSQVRARLARVAETGGAARRDIISAHL